MLHSNICCFVRRISFWRVLRRYNMTSPTYKETIAALNNLQSNAATIAKARKRRNANPNEGLVATKFFLSATGMQLSDLSKLNIIHVAGTKGKGSVCALTESILRTYGFKTGFFSSPHLVHVRERIRINSIPISESDFCKYFWPLYNKMKFSGGLPERNMPAYFTFLLLMAFRVFLDEKVDVAIIEVGIGGAYDCTNIIQKPVVCGITTLDFDHMEILGNTIKQIAWQKAGIFKEHSIAVCTKQDLEATKVILRRSRDLKCSCFFAPDYGSYTSLCNIGIPGIPQKSNASLALQISHLWMARMHDNTILPQYDEQLGCDDDSAMKAKYLKPFDLSILDRLGLENCRWPGRCHEIHKNNISYFIDGAHTPKSVELCACWFKTRSLDQNKRILIFNVTGGRSASVLLKHFLTCNFDAVLFCTNVVSTLNCLSSDDLTNFTVESNNALKNCQENRLAWLKLLFDECNQEKNGFVDLDNNNNSKNVLVFPCVESTVRWVDQWAANFKSDQVDVLVAGSLHLIGSLLSLIEPELKNHSV